MWNRCDYCGQFIAIKEFGDGGSAARNCISVEQQGIDGECKSEEWYETFHLLCAGPDPVQPGQSGGCQGQETK